MQRIIPVSRRLADHEFWVFPAIPAEILMAGQSGDAFDQDCNHSHFIAVSLCW
jgi:hypothetical protein